MIVCLCYGVSEREVQETIDAGARTVEQVSRSCGAGLGCGACHCMLKGMIQDHEHKTCSRAGVSVQPVMDAVGSDG